VEMIEVLAKFAYTGFEEGYFLWGPNF